MYGSRDMMKQSLYYLEKAHAILKNKGVSKDLADVLQNISLVQNGMGKGEASLKTAFEAADIYRKLQNNKRVGMVLMNIGITYFTMGKYDSSFKYQMEALAIREKEGNKNDLLYSLSTLGTAYMYVKNYKKAEEYLTRTLVLSESMKVKDVSNTLYNLGELKMYQGQYKEAEAYLQRTIKIAEETGNPRVLRKCYEQLAAIYKVNKDYAKASEYLKQSLEYSKKANSPYNELAALVSLSELNILEKDYDNAEKNLLQAYDIAKAHNFLMEQTTVLKSLIKVYHYNNKADKTDKLYNEYESLKDSLLNEKSLKQINELQTKYETEKKEAQIKILNSENYLQKALLQKNRLQLYANELELDKQSLEIGNKNLLLTNQELELKNNQSQLAQKNTDLKNKEQKISMLGLKNQLSKLELDKRNTQLFIALGALLAISLLSFLFYNRYKLKQEARLQAAVIAEQDEAAKAIIKAEENERQRMSATLHDGLGQLLSAAKMNMQALTDDFDRAKKESIYLNALQLLDESISEMRNVSHQALTNNVVRSGLGNALKELIEKINSNQLKVNLEIDGLIQNIHPDVQLVLYRIYQESINNVIKHANADELDIILKINTDKVYGLVKDNGKGFDASSIKSGAGIGLDNIATRIKFLKGIYKIITAPGKGTTLQFEIPV